ncbi:unnamed protein product [Clonostachys rosea f. rosea IK726]|uniref:Uncharacterized protein n=1 Tax=Clonostachys rosea f. rosea IK726 TaxID=1349383 RepID=A0ACA9UNZ5_BIOOC|nr:unnamed protein product [Clonostachys rosea f. rosea IK726]
MDLKVLADDIISWLARLDNLNYQIEIGQAELAASASKDKIAQTKPSYCQNQISTDSPKSEEGILSAAALESIPDETISENAPPNGNLYYDKNVQKFFSDFVDWISKYGRLSQKAKLSSRITQLLGKPDASHDPKALKLIKDENQPIQLSILRSELIPGSDNYTLDVYDKLEKSFMSILSAAQCSATQLLRYGNCEEKITEIRKQMNEVREMVINEIGRMDKGELVQSGRK